MSFIVLRWTFVCLSSGFESKSIATVCFHQVWCAIISIPFVSCCLCSKYIIDVTSALQAVTVFFVEFIGKLHCVTAAWSHAAGIADADVETQDSSLFKLCRAALKWTLPFGGKAALVQRGSQTRVTLQHVELNWYGNHTALCLWLHGSINFLSFSTICIVL